MKTKLYILGFLFGLGVLIFSFYDLVITENITSPISKSKISFPNTLPFAIRHTPIRLVAVGDIMLGRECNVKMSSLKDYNYPFLKIADITKKADLTFANLETPITSNCKLTSIGMVFCAQKQTLSGLRLAGFDLVNLANNHSLNQGKDGLLQTKELLTQENINYFDNEEKIISIKGTTFGFVGYNLLDKYDQNQIITKIQEIKAKSNIVILSLHWGNEYQKQPTAWQKELAHNLIDSGVDLIIGHHPHVTQAVEEYNGKMIFYSLGNFVFDQPWSEETKKGQIAFLSYKDNKFTYELKNIYMKSLCQPEIIN